MRRGLRIALGVLVVLIALAVVNAIVLDSQRQSAEVTAPDGKILELSSVDLQVVDRPATDPAAQGEPIVLLHCFACSSRWWEAMVPLLNREHRVVEIDLIGHGGSEKPTSGYEIETQGGAVAEALNELNIQGATVVGHSMGGMVATSLAETASQLVSRVVLIGTPPEAGMTELPFTARLVGTPVLGEAIWRLRTDSLIRSGYDDAFAPGFDAEGAFDDPDRLVDDNRAMTFTSFSDSDEEADDFLEEQSLVTRLRPTGVFALAIQGAEDQLFDPEEAAEKYRALPGAQVEILDGAGHSPNVELPKETAALVLEFAESDAGIEAVEPPKPPREAEAQADAAEAQAEEVRRRLGPVAVALVLLTLPGEAQPRRAEAIWVPEPGERWQYQLEGGAVDADICRKPFSGGGCVRPDIFDIDLYEDSPEGVPQPGRRRRDPRPRSPRRLLPLGRDRRALPSRLPAGTSASTAATTGGSSASRSATGSATSAGSTSAPRPTAASSSRGCAPGRRSAPGPASTPSSTTWLTPTRRAAA